MAVGRMVALIFSMVFLFLGVLFYFIGYNTGQNAEALAVLPVFDLAALDNQPVGTAGVIEGHIAERNPLQFETLVAYIQSQYQGEDCDDDGCESIWTEQERVLPPLWLDLTGGRVRINNSDYALYQTSTVWETSEEWVAHETLRYSGLVINDAVFAVGRIAPADGSPNFEADVLYLGRRDAQVAADHFSGQVLFWLGLALSLIGGGSLVLVVRGLLSEVWPKE